MNWFQHDSDSIQDAKIKKLLIRHGAIGYAVYFHCLELITADISDSNLTFELEHDSEIIADNLKIKGTSEKSGISIVEDIMRYIVELGLFTESQNRIFCIKLLKRINLSMTSNASFRDAINAKKTQYHDTVMTHHDIIMLPTIPTIPTLHNKHKTTSSATPPKPEQDESFKTFYDAYPRKEARGQALKAYKAAIRKGISAEVILDRLLVYKSRLEKAGTERQFIRLPATFLHNLDDYESEPEAPEEEYKPSLPERIATPEERAMLDRMYGRTR